MNTPDSLSPQQFQAEIGRLKEEIDMRDRLVEQLSQELFRLVEGSAQAIPSSTPSDLSSGQQKHVQMLRTQLEEVEKQVEFYQAQIEQRDLELYAQRQAVQELTDRASTLERVVQELPEIYKEKFAERLQPVEERVAQLQRENRQLHAELQSVNYRLAQRMKMNTPDTVDLPAFTASEESQAALPSLPSFVLNEDRSEMRSSVPRSTAMGDDLDLDLRSR